MAGIRLARPDCVLRQSALQERTQGRVWGPQPWKHSTLVPFTTIYSQIQFYQHKTFIKNALFKK